MTMIIPTEPIGSIPRPLELLEAVARNGDSQDAALDPLYDAAIRDTIARFEATGSPVVTDGEQRRYHNFWTYSVHGLPNTAPDGFKIPFSAGHTRRMPRLTAGPFRYKRYADAYLDVAQRYAHRPVKQAVISPSALSLMYPAEGIAEYSREEFIDDLLAENEKEIRRCLECHANARGAGGRLSQHSIEHTSRVAPVPEAPAGRRTTRRAALGLLSQKVRDSGSPGPATGIPNGGRGLAKQRCGP